MRLEKLVLLVAALVGGCTGANPDAGGGAVFDADGGLVTIDDAGNVVYSLDGSSPIEFDGAVAAQPDLVYPWDLWQGCGPTVVRPNCFAHHALGCTQSGVYRIAPPGLEETDVWCEMTEDGGGWMLAYSNSNNWASMDSANVQGGALGGHEAYRWYDAKWSLWDTKHPWWLGNAWNGTGILTPDKIGGIDINKFYKTELVEVRFEFVRGSDGARASGWCNTGGKWDWSTENSKTWRCGGTGGQRGSGHLLCLSGEAKCDEPTWNSGWNNSVTLSNMTWDYAFQSAPNAANPSDDHGGRLLGFMVAGFDQPSHLNNAVDDNYQVRIWLR